MRFAVHENTSRHIVLVTKCGELIAVGALSIYTNLRSLNVTNISNQSS